MKNIVDGGFIDLLDRLDLNVRELMDGRFGGTRRSKAYGSSPNFADFREYQPGDDLRRIDWNLYGRFEKLYLRLYEDERQLHHHIYRLFCVDGLGNTRKVVVCAENGSCAFISRRVGNGSCFCFPFARRGMPSAYEG